jgi:hypothetical protein
MLTGVIWPLGPYAVDINAPDEEPWRRLAHRRDMKEYFDEVYDEILSLKQVPMPKGKRTRYRSIVPGKNLNGLASFLQTHDYCMLAKVLNVYRSSAVFSGNMVGRML